jgi:hypothetical protein
MQIPINQKENPMQYTTVAIDKYGRIYDLSKEHPSYEQSKKNKGKKSTGYEECIVVNAFTIPVDEVKKLGRKKKGK